jgi:protein gp37
MNKQGSRKIEWTDYTWNPITGCLQGCAYCYARKVYERFKKSFKPSFHPERLYQPTSVKGKRIFVCSTSDFFGKGIAQAWRMQVYQIINKCPSNIFQILTKRPENIPDCEIEHIPCDNVILGVTITSEKDQWRMSALEEKFTSRPRRWFVSYEPMLGPLKVNYENEACPSWIILGAMTGAKKAPIKYQWITDVQDWASVIGCPIFMKQSLRNYVKDFVQEFPKEPSHEN